MFDCLQKRSHLQGHYFFPTEFLNVAIKRQNVQHKHVCPQGQFKQISKRGNWMEESEVKLISQGLGTNSNLEMFSQIKKEFWCGAPYGKHA